MILMLLMPTFHIVPVDDCNVNVINANDYNVMNNRDLSVVNINVCNVTNGKEQVVPPLPLV